MIEGSNIEFSTDGGETWSLLGTLAEPFNCTATEEVTRAAVDAVFPSGPFTITGTLEVKVRNYQLEGMARRPLRVVERTPYAANGKPWQKRKKGRAGHGY